MADRLKVALFITRMIRGGAQKVVLELLNGLDRKKFEPVLIVGETPETEPNFLGDIAADVRVLRVNSVKREISPVNDLLSLLRLRMLFIKQRFDIVHLHTSKAGALGAFAGSMAGIRRIIYTPHGHIFHRGAGIPGVDNLPAWKMKLLYRIRKLAYGKSDVLVALSESDLKEQVGLGLAGRSKFRIVMNGVDLNHFSPAPSRGGGNGRVKIGSVGRLSREKGHDILVRAMPDILEKHSEAELSIVGSGPEKKNLEELAGNIGISDRISFEGHVDDPLPSYRSFDVFVLPSRYESQGMALMEAMGCGLPVAAADVGGVASLVSDAENGLLVPPEEPAGFAQAVISLLDEPGLREKLSINARKKAEKEFSIARMLCEYENLYLGRE